MPIPTVTKGATPVVQKKIVTPLTKVVMSSTKVVTPPNKAITPGPTKAQIAAQNKRIVDQLVRIFQMENPPADYIEVVRGSVKPVDVKFHLYKALVHTAIYLHGKKEHFSNIRFKTDRDGNAISNSVTFL